MDEPDPYAGSPLLDRLQMLAFEAELAHLPFDPSSGQSRCSPS
jgi:hypothetical protein